MPRLATRPKPWKQLALGFETPTQAERITARANARKLDEQFDAVCRLVSQCGDRTISVHLDGTPVSPGLACCCHSCGSQPSGVTMDNSLDVQPFGNGRRFFPRSEPRIDLTCHCGQNWSLPQGFQVVVRDRAAPPEPNEVLLIEDYGSLLYARSPEQPRYAGDFANTYANELTCDDLQRARQRMQDEMYRRMENHFYRATFSTI